MNKLTTDAAFRKAVQGDGIAVVVFKTTWCPDCHFIDPFMPDVEQQYSGKISFYEIDRDELPDLCSELNILGIPSFIAFRNSKELIRFVNKLRKTRDEIEQFLERAIQVAEALPQE
ncbi:thioredoxin family protein [Paenibacillus glycanilyticus]|uniref:thioredoxin family protein n=1 Tax=Paenibacillus glycanilyticus TaxID=126569 RepID=UPI00203F3DEF|nr:thioredoxin family protein [Paenibacillus glycanilyticus]MCM3629287.1 thioredoxin family protein [Paenibacillus glycanilyticus]